MSKQPLYSDEPTDSQAFTDKFDREYSRMAAAYDVTVRWLPVWKGWLREALAHIEGPRVLETSFGTGWLLTQYAGSVEAHGIDYNERMVEIALANLTRAGVTAQLRRADAADLPYDDSFFDCVVNTMALSGYPDADAALAELRRVLRPKGKLVLIDVGYPGDGNWLGTRLTRMWAAAGDLIRDVTALLERHGFEITDSEIGGFGSVHLWVGRKQ